MLSQANRQLVAFLILALVGGWAIKGSADSSADKLYRSQIEACERGNTLRAESNRRVTSHEVDRNALVAFLNAAESARVSAYERDGNEADKVAAEDYADLAELVRNQVVFEPVSIVDCTEVIEKP